MHEVRMLKAASRDLAALDKEIAGRVMGRIRWLADNFESIRPKPLAADLAGLYKLREGDYRIIYEVLRKEKKIVIHAIGHRSQIYRRK